uniref:Granulin n=1 Tax=Panagrellus redivivus TaxID=6233 RepID=A0A7E4ZRU3_PANRE
MQTTLVVCFSLCLVAGVSALVTCPDNVSACPDGTTCCALGEGTYGCCPIPKAVCCADQQHCCPHDTVCDVEEGRCTHHSGRHYPLHKKTAAMRADSDSSESSEEVEGPPTQRFEIPVNYHQDDDELLTGDDLSLQMPGSENTVSSPRQNAPFWSENPRLAQAPNGEVTCSDGSSKCPEGTTCCALAEGVFGCCPVEDAVCCEDHLHCCPHGTTCDVSEGRCVNSKTYNSVPWYRKFAATKIVRKRALPLKEGLRICNGGSCKSTETCCGGGSLSTPKCCPHAFASCCEDGSCCPKGFQCDGSNGCVSRTDGLSVFTAKVSSHRSNPMVDYAPADETDEPLVMCPDMSFCPHGQSCCASEGNGQNGYKCCGLKHATCCQDSCCPRGFHCIQEGQNRKCERSALTHALFKELSN